MKGSLLTASLSIILPTYNRAAFLPQAFDSIRSQTFEGWELIIVDDGSTDNTREVVEQFAREAPQSVRYVFQENRGPGPARNLGIESARGQYVAFFDSDDVWLAHHLADCVAAFEESPDVDWVAGAHRRVDYDSGDVLTVNSFQARQASPAFIRLRTRELGKLTILDDDRMLLYLLDYRLPAGLHESVFRREVLGKLRFPARRIGEDRVFAAELFAAGCRFGYLDRVHAVRYQHRDNSCAAAKDLPLIRRVRIQRELQRSYEELAERVPLNRAEHRAWRRRLAHEYFWGLGYNILWMAGRYLFALRAFRKGLTLTPWSISLWKTYIAASIKYRILYRKQWASSSMCP